MEQVIHDQKVTFQVEIEFSETIVNYESVQREVFAALADHANYAGLKPDDEGGYTRFIIVRCLSVDIPTIQGDPFPIEEILSGGKYFPSVK